MAILIASFLAFAIAFSVTFVELVTSDYPRTGFLVTRCWKLYLYAGIYGGIASGVTACWGYLVEAGLISFSGTGDSNVWLRAGVIGFSAKALLHIRLFTVHTGGGDGLPIGVETFVQPFEPWLLNQIELYHFNELRSFLEGIAAVYTDLDEVKEMILDDIAAWERGRPERRAFRADVEEAETVLEATEYYLRIFGRNNVRRLFGDAFDAGGDPTDSNDN